MNHQLKASPFILTFLFAAAVPTHAQVPVATYLDQAILKSVLTNGWQRKLNTDKDPANGNKWNTHNGGNGFGEGGLFGSLRVTLLAPQFASPGREIRDNRGPVELGRRSFVNSEGGVKNTEINFQATFNETLTYETVRYFGSADGAPFSISMKGEMFGDAATGGSYFPYGIDAKTGGKNFPDFIGTNANTGQPLTTRTLSVVSREILPIPYAQKVMALLMVDQDIIRLPFRVDALLAGQTNTWFGNQVNGHYNWYDNVGSVLSHSNNVPRDWTLPKDGSGAVRMHLLSGWFSGKKARRFYVQYYDVTNGGAPKFITEREAAVK